MDEERKCAILDTDFVSKANIIKTETSVLADEVLEFPDYQFFCHQKMKEELGNHGTEEAQLWLERKISSGEITCSKRYGHSFGVLSAGVPTGKILRRM